MRIGELAQRAGISPSTIHYYERIDLLRPADREGASYRYYDETVYRRLEKITARKRWGSNLDDIAAALYREDTGGIKGEGARNPRSTAHQDRRATRGADGVPQRFGKQHRPHEIFD